MDTKLKEILKQIKENESAISMLLGMAVVLVVAVLLFNYYQQGRKLNQKQSFLEPTKTAVISDEAVTTGSEPLPLKENEYEVKAGDNLWRIAQVKYDDGYRWVEIAKENQLANASLIEVGQRLKLPGDGLVSEKKPNLTEHTVLRGESLWSIASSVYGDGFEWTKIFAANQNMVADPGYIEIGWVLKLP